MRGARRLWDAAPLQWPRHHRRRRQRFLVRLRAGVLPLRPARPTSRSASPTAAIQARKVRTTAPSARVTPSVARSSKSTWEQCLQAGLNVEGINAEVATGQWEFQIFAKGAKEAGDQIWIARYLLERIGEAHDVWVNWHCKPLGDTDWNGSGMHANFSNTAAAGRPVARKCLRVKICQAFAPDDIIKACIDVYGPDNELRLTGKHETAPWNKFSYGVSDRGASIRIPIGAVQKGWKGWLEDRRPNSAADPYKVAARIIKTVKSAEI